MAESASSTHCKEVAKLVGAIEVTTDEVRRLRSEEVAIQNRISENKKVLADLRSKLGAELKSVGRIVDMTITTGGGAGV